MKNKPVFSSVYCLIVLFTIACEKDNTGLISGEQEMELGRMTDSIIVHTPSVFPILDTANYKYVYAYLDTLTDDILKSKYLSRKTTFEYQFRIIDDDRLHAFAAPGGYLYFYTGLLKYLSNGAQFAGLMSHQVAHIDRRHITENIENRYGIDQLLGVTLYHNHSLLPDIVNYITSASQDSKFSANQEYEADEYAVKYTSGTDYNPGGIADFYTRLLQVAADDNIPEFLIVHPDPGNRLEKINTIITEMEIPEGSLFEREYNVFKQSLP